MNLPDDIMKSGHKEGYSNSYKSNQELMEEIMLKHQKKEALSRVNNKIP
jgi:hypothetical protein